MYDRLSCGLGQVCKRKEARLQGLQWPFGGSSKEEEWSRGAVDKSVRVIMSWRSILLRSLSFVHTVIRHPNLIQGVHNFVDRCIEIAEVKEDDASSRRLEDIAIF